MEIVSYGLSLLATLLAAGAQVFLKTSANQTGEQSFLKKFLNKKVIFSYSIMFVSLTLNTLALRVMPLKNLPAITATSFIWILLLSALFLKEKPSRNRVLGTLIIFVGVLISISG